MANNTPSSGRNGSVLNIGIGMLIDLSVIPGIWQWALLGTLALLSSKIVLVAWLVRRSGLARLTSALQ